MSEEIDHLARIVAHLGETQVLHRLSPESRRRVARSASPIDLRAGQTLCQAGDPADSVYVVLDGEVEIISRSAEGVDVRIAALAHGAIIGEMAALEGGARSVDMVASRRSRLYRIPRHALIEVLRTDAEAALELIVELSRRLRASNAALEASVRLGLGGRLARLLSLSANVRGVVALTQTELARRLGVSREKVNRRLHEWVAAGIIASDASGIRILSPARLRAVMNTSKHH